MSGVLTVFKKELADHFASWRFIILFIIILLTGAFAIYVAAQAIRGTETTSHFIFLALFTVSGDSSLPSFLSFIGYLIPIVGIALGFDAVNSENNSGTMSRLLSQPIYRDSIINGKFLAGMVTIAVIMASIILLVTGFGIRMIGLPPNSEEAGRLLLFLVVSVIYGSFWMALAVMFSVFFRRVATSALASIAIWVFSMFFMSAITNAIAGAIAPPGETQASQLRNLQVQVNIMHISPITLFQEATVVILVPGMRTLSQLLQMQTGAGDFLLGTPLSLSQSTLIVWPQLVGLVVLTVLCFAVSYIRFMREEIRAT